MQRRRSRERRAATHARGHGEGREHGSETASQVQLPRGHRRAVSLVGFSLIFQQTNASAALALRLKQAFPHLRIVVGGACCDGRCGRGASRHRAASRSGSQSMSRW
jgi:hypothetical protein